MKNIQKIMCCCGNGVVTSLVMQMTVEEALENMGMTGVEVLFGPLAEISEESADLFVVSDEILDTLEGLPAIGLEDLMDADLAQEQLEKFLESD